jgi:hypothetical protein
VEGRIESGVYVRPCDGETLSGDVVFVQPQGDGLFASVIDVLGHGPDAHRLGVQLSGALSGWLPEATPPTPEGALAVLHESARGTRGAVAAVAWLNTQTLEGWVVGAGNVAIFGWKTIRALALIRPRRSLSMWSDVSARAWTTPHAR